MGVLLGAAGAGILMVLMRIPERLDTLLLVSTAIANLISGLSRLSIGVLQLTGVMVVVLVTLFALMLLVGGGMRLLRAVAPRPGKTP
jgi:Flp pilus assembly protein protease CpaA